MKRVTAVIALLAAALVTAGLPAGAATTTQQRTTYHVFVAESRLTTSPLHARRLVLGKVYVDTWLRLVDMSNRQTGYSYRYLAVGRDRYSYPAKGEMVLLSETFGISHRVTLDRNRLDTATASGWLRYQKYDPRTGTTTRLPRRFVTATWTAIDRPASAHNVSHTPGYPTSLLHERMLLVNTTLTSNVAVPGRSMLNHMFTLRSKGTCPPDV